jgi:hypothetical protein
VRRQSRADVKGEQRQAEAETEGCGDREMQRQRGAELDTAETEGCRDRVEQILKGAEAGYSRDREEQSWTQQRKRGAEAANKLEIELKDDI